MPSNRIWIMDGHNMIFAIAALRRLQASDRREEARAGLAERLERFAVARGERVLVVFDGNQMTVSPDAFRQPLFETVYARRGEGVADDRIIREAEACLKRGLQVTVVTNDVSTLASKLPRGVQHLKVQAFWLKRIEKDAGEGGKRVEGDFSDLEREMLAQAAMSELAPEVRKPTHSPAASARRRAGAAASPQARVGASAEDAERDRILLKRERGRLRHARRLGRRTKSGRSR